MYLRTARPLPTGTFYALLNAGLYLLQGHFHRDFYALLNAENKKLSEAEQLQRLQACAAEQKGDEGYFNHPPSLLTG